MATTLQELKTMRDTIRQRLEASEDFVAWHGLNELIKQLEPASGTATPALRPQANQRPPPPSSGTDRKMSQIDYSIHALITKGHPLSTAALIPEIEKAGGKIGGSKPRVNLAGILSKSPRVKSVPWHGSKGWWPVDQPVPNAHRETADAAIND